MLICVLVRALDEYRFGRRDVTSEDLVDLARASAIINAGETPAEVAARLGRGAHDNR